MSLRWQSPLAACLVALLIAAACGDDASPDPAAPSQSVVGAPSFAHPPSFATLGDFSIDIDGDDVRLGDSDIR